MRAKRNYRLIVENSSDIIFTLNEVGDLFIFRLLLNILGYSATDLIGHPFRSVLHPDDIKIVQEAIKHNIMDGRQTPAALNTGSGIFPVNGAGITELGIQSVTQW